MQDESHNPRTAAYFLLGLAYFVGIVTMFGAGCGAMAAAALGDSEMGPRFGVGAATAAAAYVFAKWTGLLERD